MALLVKKTKFKNTEVEAPELYVRLQYLAKADGLRTSVMLMSGLTKEDALSWKKVDTDLPEQIILEMAENEQQDLSVIHQKVKTELEIKGFEVVINLA